MMNWLSKTHDIDLRIALLQSSQTYRAITPEEQAVNAFGQAIYNGPFAG
jgi:hypothetical protein